MTEIVDCLFACDLDRTLIYSLAAAVLGGGYDPADPDALLCVELLDGRPISYVTPDVPSLLRVLSALCVFVPVTTRTVLQYRRIRLFADDCTPEWAICANGGHILHRGRPDASWHRSIVGIVADTGIDPQLVVRRMVALGDWVLNAKVADEVFGYAVVDLSRADAPAIAELGHWLGAHGWVLSRQGRKIYAAPAGVEKWAAVQEVRDRSGTLRVGAAGDSLLDRKLLERADFSVRPPHGELEVVGCPVDVLIADAGVKAGAGVLAAGIAWAGRG